MSGRIRIISDGTARTTHVLDAKGDKIKWGSSGLTKIEILPIMPDGIVEAVFTVQFVAVDIEGVAILHDKEILPP
jgi:hypothetical protein